MSKKDATPIPFESLCDGYRLTVANSMDLLMASFQLLEQPSVGLAVAELGQEELGKSLSILAATSLQAEPAAWEWFWSDWRNHTLKAHRAFLYELISPVRLEGRGSDGSRLAGASLRGSLPKEKEGGFYIAYDHEQSKFVSPSDEVGPIEAYHRSLTLLYLRLTARAVLRTLEARPDRLWYRLFGHVAFRICTEALYQQQMPQFFVGFGSLSEQHPELLQTLNGSLLDARDELQAIVDGERATLGRRHERPES